MAQLDPRMMLRPVKTPLTLFPFRLRSWHGAAGGAVEKLVGSRSFARLKRKWVLLLLAWAVRLSLPSMTALFCQEIPSQLKIVYPKADSWGFMLT